MAHARNDILRAQAVNFELFLLQLSVWPKISKIIINISYEITNFTEYFCCSLFAFVHPIVRINTGDDMELNYTEIGRRIAERRKHKKLSQQALAEILGISNNHLSSIECGKAGPSLELLVGICNALRLSPDFLLMGSMHSSNLPANITDNLALCSDRDIELLYKISCMMVDRNGERWNVDNHIK